MKWIDFGGSQSKAKVAVTYYFNAVDVKLEVPWSSLKSLYILYIIWMWTLVDVVTSLNHRSMQLQGSTSVFSTSIWNIAQLLPVFEMAVTYLLHLSWLNLGWEVLDLLTVFSELLKCLCPSLRSETLQPAAFLCFVMHKIDHLSSSTIFYPLIESGTPISSEIASGESALNDSLGLWECMPALA